MDLELLEHLCTLSKIGMDDGDKEEVLGQMSRIIDLMDSIQTVKTTPLPPAPGVALDDLRADEAAPSLSHAEALQNATDVEDGCFTVPKIME